MRCFQWVSARLMAGAALLAVVPSANAQHLLWRYPQRSGGYSCVYGEITVLATNRTTYYCGCNWWPGNPAGGYAGIQDVNDASKFMCWPIDSDNHLMIFSIWDTAPGLNPSTVYADPHTVANRFGGEGTGAHTHLDYNWKLGQTFRYFLYKRPDASGANTLTDFVFYDPKNQAWTLEATISSPNNGSPSVPTFGGALYSFLENWSGEERDKPKMALYRLWVGNSPDHMHCLTQATGDGNWGTMNDAFYLAEGKEDYLGYVFEKKHEPGMPRMGADDRNDPMQISDRPVPEDVRQLQLPRS